jgi:hypothetical protein
MPINKNGLLDGAAGARRQRSRRHRRGKAEADFAAIDGEAV